MCAPVTHTKMTPSSCRQPMFSFRISSSAMVPYGRSWWISHGCTRAPAVIRHRSIMDVVVNKAIGKGAPVFCPVELPVDHQDNGAQVAVEGLTGSVMMTPNLPSTLMSKLRTSQFTHCGSCSACMKQ